MESKQNQFKAACELGNLEDVNTFLKDSDVDPSAGKNSAIRRAAYNGHVEVVKVLLADPRVDPTADDNYAIKSTAQDGHAEAVKELLGDPRVDPTANNNYAIRHAAENGHAEVVKVLLADHRVDPTVSNNFLIRTAAEKGHAELVKVLLADPRIDPAAKDNYAIRYAAHEGHVEVVKLLSADHRVASSVDINAFIQRATQNNHVEVVNFLKTKRDTDVVVDSAALYLDVQPVPASHFTFLKFLKLCGVFLLSAALLLAIGGLIGGLFGVWPDINAFFEAIHLVTDWGIGVVVTSGVLALTITAIVGLCKIYQGEPLHSSNLQLNNEETNKQEYPKNTVVRIKNDYGFFGFGFRDSDEPILKQNDVVTISAYNSYDGRYLVMKSTESKNSSTWIPSEFLEPVKSKYEQHNSGANYSTAVLHQDSDTPSPPKKIIVTAVKAFIGKSDEEFSEIKIGEEFEVLREGKGEWENYYSVIRNGSKKDDWAEEGYIPKDHVRVNERIAEMRM